MSSGPRRDHTGPGSAPATASRDDPARAPDDAALREAVEAVSETGPDRGLLDDDLPSATDHPFAPTTLPPALAARPRQLGLQLPEPRPRGLLPLFAPSTLTHAMAARARQLGLQLPKPRLRGMLHLFAFPATMVAGLVLVALGESLAIRLACVIFVVTAGLLFGVSATYHRGTWSPQRAIMLRRFDHANIFLIVAGTYTPIAVALLQPRQAVPLLGIAWGGAAVGVAFRLFWTGAPRWLYVPAYIALGWVAVFYMPQLHAGGGWPVVWLLLAGGLAYTAGAVVYALKRPDASPVWFGCHEIFHAGTLAGFACHFVAVAISVR